MAGRGEPGFTRRGALRSLLGGSLLLPGVLTELLAADEDRRTPADPLRPKAPHFPARAKRVILLFMTGGVSHVDSFDFKPKLFADDGKSLGSVHPQGGKAPRTLMGPSWGFKRWGKSGLEVSDLFQNVARCADDLCVIRSLKTDHANHFEATLGMHSGSVTVARPSIGSWVSYGLGSFNRNMPSFILIAPELPYAGGLVSSSDFLPGDHRGTRVDPAAEPIPNMTRRLESPGLQERELGLVEAFNREYLRLRPGDGALGARLRSFESAFGMQREAPEVFDLTQESDATLRLYGLQRGSTKGFGWQCLVARRLAERGVRFIELVDVGADSNHNWDTHYDMARYGDLARNVDLPIAALLRDLKSRGMLEETLVVWTTEFGRTPFKETPDGKGRDHHPACFSSWLAGGGVKGGLAYGSTDEYGMQIAEAQVHVHDFHATILHLLGLDHTRLTYRYSGRDFRLTDVAGKVVGALLA